MIRRRDLVRALGDPDVADWVLVEHEQEVASVDEARRVRRDERRTKWHLTAHVDTPTGRGSAFVSIDAADGDAEAIVRQTIELARASIGPAWVTRPAAAPARVQLQDPALLKRDLLDVASSIARTVQRPPGSKVVASAQLLRDKVNMLSAYGVRTDWTATLVRVDLLVSVGDRSISITREARRLEDLGLDAAIASALDDLRTMSGAVAMKPGKRAIVLRRDAMLHDGLGVWSVFVPQADAVVERQGLTRYRERTLIAAPGVEPLTVISDGARDFGLLSAPMGEQGDAVRRFALVERGMAAGLGLSPREGALRGRDPNGGVRNLVVDTGSWTGAIDAAARPVLEIRRLRSLSLDPYTGDASLEIGIAIDHADGTQQPVVGGSLRVDMIAALAGAWRSSTGIARGAYIGPDAVLFEGADVLP